MLTDFVSAGGQGIEVVTTPNRTSDAIGMADRAKRYGLYGSLGSDFHHPNHTWRNLGWLAPLPDGVTPIYQAF
jgi:predicted metal-dependent phosphoesterase TrpH